jgi:hypothetical protein
MADQPLAARRALIENAMKHKSFSAGWDFLNQFTAYADAANAATTVKSGDPSMSVEIRALQAQIDALKRQAAPPIGGPQEFTAAQIRAQPAYAAFGDSAPPPLNGETVHAFRLRLLTGMQPNSPKWKAVTLAGIHPSMLNGLEQEIYNDAQAHSSDPLRFKRGEMRAVVMNDGAGRPITKYVGHPDSCWDQFNPPTKFAKEGLKSFRTPNGFQ